MDMIPHQPDVERQPFVFEDMLEWEVLSDKIRRKIMAYDAKMMLVKVAFEQGGVGVVHQHHHTQVTYVESGVFEVEVAGAKSILKAGDVFLAPSMVWHGAVCLESGVLIDTFAPMREDFLTP